MNKLLMLFLGILLIGCAPSKDQIEEGRKDTFIKVIEVLKKKDKDSVATYMEFPDIRQQREMEVDVNLAANLLKRTRQEDVSKQNIIVNDTTLFREVEEAPPTYYYSVILHNKDGAKLGKISLSFMYNSTSSISDFFVYKEFVNDPDFKFIIPE